MLRATLLNLIALAVIVVCVIYSFENGYHNQFTFDDHLAIEGNGDVDVNHQPFSHLWLSDIWGKDLLAHDSHRSYRPFLIVIFRYLYSISHDPSIFRLICIISHSLTSVASFYWSKLLLNGENLNGIDRFVIALVTAVFFATHPVHVEAVTAVVNLAESLSALFIIIGYMLFHLSTLYIQRNAILSWTILLAWWIVGITATLLKETGILIALIPLVYILGRWIVAKVGNLLIGPKTQSNSQMRLVSIPISFVWIVNSITFLYIYFAARSLLVNPKREELLQKPMELIVFVSRFWWDKAGDSYLNASQLLRRAENPYAFLSPPQVKIMSMLYLYFRYFFLLIWPMEQSPEYSFDCIPSIQDWQDYRFLVALATIAGIFVFGIYSCCVLQLSTDRSSVPDSQSDKKEIATPPAEKNSASTALFEGMIWLIISFLPLTGIVFTLGTLLAERLLYMCSLGYCFLLSYVLYSVLVSTFARYSNRLRIQSILGLISRILYIAIVSSIVYFFIWRTRQYNLVWKDDAHLFLHAVSVCPTSAKSNLQVSKLYSNQGYMTLARHHWQRARDIDPDFCDVHLQEAYILLGKDNGKTTAPISGVSTAVTQEMSLDITAEDIMDRIQRASFALTRSLSCVYTGQQALRLLQQLWDIQLLATQSYPHMLHETQTVGHSLPQLQRKYRAQMLRRQAKTAQEAQLNALAITKYMEAANLLFEYLPLPSEPKKRYYEQKAMYVLSQAQKILREMISQPMDSSSVNPSRADQQLTLSLDAAANSVIVPLKCRVSVLAGGMRSSWLEHFRPSYGVQSSSKQPNTATKSKEKGKQAQVSRNSTEQKKWQWVAGAFRIVDDLARATDSYCMSQVVGEQAAGSLEQAKIASMHAWKWMQELDDALLHPKLLPFVGDYSTDMMEKLSLANELTYPIDSKFVKSNYSGVQLVNISYLPPFAKLLNNNTMVEMMEGHIRRDLWLPLTSFYCDTLLFVSILQESPSQMLQQYRQYLQSPRIQLTSSSKDNSPPANVIWAMLQGEKQASRQIVVVSTHLLHRHYLHRRFHLAADTGALYLLQKLLPLVSFTHVTSSKKPLSNEEAMLLQQQHLYREFQSRAVRLWHYFQHRSSSISGNRDFLRSLFMLSSRYFVEKLPREQGHALLAFHSNEIWQNMFPLESFVNLIGSDTRLASFLQDISEDEDTSENFSSLELENVVINVKELKSLFKDAVFCTNLYW